MLIIVQIGAALFALFAVSRAAILYKRNVISGSQMALWAVVWLVISLAALFPELTSFIAKKVGIVRGVDLLLYVGMVSSFYLIYRIYVQIEKVERNMTKIVRELALMKGESADDTADQSRAPDSASEE